MTSRATSPLPPAGHNGGPPLETRPRLARKITPTQHRALSNIKRHGDTLHGLHGRSFVGGYNNTRVWLDTNGLRDPWVNDAPERLTERGERVLSAGRMVD